MIRACLVIGCLLLAVPASAQVKPEFTEQEAGVAIELWNAGLKSLGSPSAEAFLVLSKRMQAAIEESRKPKPKPDAEPAK